MNWTRASPRTRVLAIVAAVAAVAAGLTVGVTVLTATHPGEAAPKARPGTPPLVLDLGVRIDGEARALRRAARLYASGRRRQAAQVFEAYDSLQARVGLAFARWPDDSLRRVEQLASEASGSAFAQLHLGFAFFWTGHGAQAVAAWRRAVRAQPDSASAVEADTLLHPNFARGLPAFVPTFGPPPGLSRLSPPRQLRALASAARRRDAHAKILYGVALQHLGRPLSAERQYTAAAELAPNDPQAQTAAAVGSFTKAAPVTAFSRLGPLTRRFPHAATVRFHLGLLLLWTGRLEAARIELRKAVADDPNGPLGREARLLLARLKGVRTARTP